MKNAQSVEKKKKYKANNKTSSNSSSPSLSSSKTPTPAILGLEAGLKIKLNRVSRVGREGKDQATR